MSRKFLLSTNMLSNTSLRFFQTSPVRFSNFPPHSQQYIEDQLRVLATRGTMATSVALKKGTKLVGLNVHFVENELVEGAAPLYTRSTLSNFSAKEIEKFIYMDANYSARVVNFEVREDMMCAATKTESGDPIYFVHMTKLNIDSMQRISDALKLPLTSSLTKK